MYTLAHTSSHGVYSSSVAHRSLAFRTQRTLTTFTPLSRQFVAICELQLLQLVEKSWNYPDIDLHMR